MSTNMPSEKLTYINYGWSMLIPTRLVLNFSDKIEWRISKHLIFIKPAGDLLERCGFGCGLFMTMRRRTLILLLVLDILYQNVEKDQSQAGHVLISYIFIFKAASHDPYQL